MKITLNILLLLILFQGHAQNLVPNGDFEQYDGCPSQYAQLDSASYWFNPSTYPGAQTGSPDYFNVCATLWVGVPNNMIGYQTAHSGVGYAGLILWGDTAFYDNNREYLEVELSSPLEMDSCYHFSAFINLGNYSRFSTDTIAVHFSDTIIQGINNWYPIDVSPHISYDGGMLLDTVNWTLFEGNFKASGGESYLIIGNFNDDLNTNSMEVDPCCEPAAYFLIDDVSLIKTSCPSTVGINEVQLDEKELIKIIDVTGRETHVTPNTLLLYIFSDGTIEKVFIVE